MNKNQWKKRISYLLACLLIVLQVKAADEKRNNEVNIPFNKGTLHLKIMSPNAIRVQYMEGEGRELSEWIYLPEAGEGKVKFNADKLKTEPSSKLRR